MNARGRGDDGRVAEANETESTDKSVGDHARDLLVGGALATAGLWAPAAPVPEALQPVDPVERSAYELLSGVNEGLGELGQVLKSAELAEPVPEPEAADHSDPPPGSLWDDGALVSADDDDGADAYANDEDGADAYDADRGDPSDGADAADVGSGW